MGNVNQSGIVRPDMSSSYEPPNMDGVNEVSEMRPLADEVNRADRVVDNTRDRPTHFDYGTHAQTTERVYSENPADTMHESTEGAEYTKRTIDDEDAMNVDTLKVAHARTDDSYMNLDSVDRGLGDPTFGGSWKMKL